jgi:hypothetical protein
MWPSGLVGSASGQNPAASPAVLAAEGAGDDLGFVRDRLVCGFGAERPPVSGRRCGPLRPGGAGEGGSLGETNWAQRFQIILEEG